MATATRKKTSDPDYSPTERLLAEVEELGRSEERKRREPVVAQARRGAARRATAKARQEGEAIRRAEAERRALDATRRRKSRNQRREEETASARRGAFASGQAKARRDAQAQARSVAGPKAGGPSALAAGAGGSSAKLSSPTVTILPGSGISGGLDRATAARIVILITGVCAIAVVATSAITQAPGKVEVQVGNERIRVPQHLRALSGVIVAGTISLFAVEIMPGLGLALGLLLGIDILGTTVFNKGGLASRLGGITAPGLQLQPVVPLGTPLTNVPKNINSPESKKMIAWIHANPGKLPHPNRPLDDFWNTFARNTASNAQIP